MRIRLLLSAATAAFLAALVPVVAHHSVAAEFDTNKPVSATGTLTKVEWRNPHSWLHIDVKSADGSVVAWQWELGSPNSLMRRGWRRDDLPIGEVVTVDGYAAKEGIYKIPTGSTRKIKLPNGKELFDGPPPESGEK